MKRPTTAQLQQVVQQIDPHATLIRAWPLRGGISAQMTALEIAQRDSTRGKLIVRRPAAATHPPDPAAAVTEFRILQIVQQVGVKTQRPYLVDTSMTILPTPYLVIEYIEGEAVYAPADVIGYAEQAATQLARLHAVNRAHAEGVHVDLTFLPQQMPRLTRLLTTPPPVLDATLQEARVREVLHAVWPLPPSRPATLLHGDFWPGNWLWRDNELVAVIDWEDAEVGEPLADLAITRLDMLWIMGQAAMEAFTATYQAAAGGDFALLPYWDLVAALRPASHLAEWAAVWPELGRADITLQSMQRHHRAFVAQALAQL